MLTCEGQDNYARKIYLASKLYHAIEEKDLRDVRFFLDKKADPNFKHPKKGFAPFHLAVGDDCPDFSYKVTLLILQNGGDPNLRAQYGVTPVHIAASLGRVDVLKLLLNSGGDPEAKDAEGNTPAYYAWREDFSDCLVLLSDYAPIKNDLIESEEKDACRSSLDKIIIDCGDLVKQYDISSNDSVVGDQDQLKSLPRINATENILNWFSQQQQASTSTSSTITSTNNFVGNSFKLDWTDDSVVESDGDDREAKRYDHRFITFRKVYRKSRSKSSRSSLSKTEPPKLEQSSNVSSNKKSIYVSANNEFTHLTGYSKESGIVTLESTSLKQSMNEPAQHRQSSDYLSFTNDSINVLEKNIDEVNLSDQEEEQLLNNNICDSGEGGSNGSSTELSFVSVSEVYKHVDEEQGVTLYEKRLLKTSGETAKSVRSSILSSQSLALDYDSDTLRQELTSLGHKPGPITVTTKRVYLRRLHSLKKHPVAYVKDHENEINKKVYSPELEKTLKKPDWCTSDYKSLEQELAKQFSSPDPSRKWREGVNKTSFTYLLLDPRITNDLPNRKDRLQPLEVWNTFVSSIFYVGKGKRTRPFQHLYDAMDLWKKGQFQTSNTKLQKIMDIWQSGSGVICLNVFHNIIPVEAYTREAAMISAIKKENLTNCKSGEFYGESVTWTQKKQRMLGVYLLHKAMKIFFSEGERQLCPRDID
ncbi:unnamed protein product [Ceutorhynchus assimilis]|uniref:LEM domain-containing protein n=1 Tax=Ceutorhynchus assimilis TaxID=467358 RepID=A0A9N9MW45_9CUCU|nr:unnamed protein product [Ceutorhynchus assimilis]